VATIAKSLNCGEKIVQEIMEARKWFDKGTDHNIQCIIDRVTLRSTTPRWQVAQIYERLIQQEQDRQQKMEDVAWQAKKKALFTAELTQLTLKELKKRARAEGVSTDALAEADDEDDPKMVITDMLVTKAEEIWAAEVRAAEAEREAARLAASRIKAEEKEAARVTAAEEATARAARTCTNCGQEQTSGFKFCTGCGTKAEAPAAAPISLAKFGPSCGECGVEQKPGYTFCTECGTKAEAPAAVPAATVPAMPLEESLAETQVRRPLQSCQPAVELLVFWVCGSSVFHSNNLRKL
jgi:hypothetical protein